MNRVISLIMAFICFSCLSTRSAKNDFQPSFAPGPHALVYKTTKDYRNNVPVILSVDKSVIVSYPHPSDLFIGAKFATPTILRNGFLLDNKGINENSAFLDYTYQKYSELSVVPSLESLYKSIIEMEPLIELWDCGLKSSYTDIEGELNKMILNGQIEKKCKRIK